MNPSFATIATAPPLTRTVMLKHLRRGLLYRAQSPPPLQASVASRFLATIGPNPLRIASSSPPLRTPSRGASFPRRHRTTRRLRVIHKLVIHLQPLPCIAAPKSLHPSPHCKLAASHSKVVRSRFGFGSKLNSYWSQTALLDWSQTALLDWVCMINAAIGVKWYF
ncbi:unnamed protein product [Sphenostylis stenocarpa]|uniref:Uncharacterized protein n=1 Tax=Sphenostylis stenocarpa TaxID=92480 RepID=A0AA86VKA2_9FABA|nr:unnamed protein product [Sphenostylis stenocarpa]